MKLPKLPPVLSQAILFALATALQYLLDNIGVWNIPPIYAPMISLAITTAITMIKEALPKKPDPVAQARAMGQAERPAGYWQRVLLD